MIGYVAQPITNVMWDKGIVTLIVIVLEIWFVVSTTVLLEILQWIAVEDHEYVSSSAKIQFFLCIPNNPILK